MMQTLTAIRAVPLAAATETPSLYGQGTAAVNDLIATSPVAAVAIGILLSILLTEFTARTGLFGAIIGGAALFFTALLAGEAIVQIAINTGHITNEMLTPYGFSRQPAFAFGIAIGIIVVLVPTVYRAQTRFESAIGEV